MEQYKILGVDENASMEEIRIAYENKINKLREEVRDERRVKAFIKVFDKAYEEIKLQREKNNYQEAFVKDINKNNFRKDGLDKYDNFDDDKDKLESKKRAKKSSSNNSFTKEQRSDKRRASKNSSNENAGEKCKRDNAKKTATKKDEESSIISKLIQTLLKIIALPIIAMLSIIIVLCKLINLISWIATKIIIILSVGVASIHGYQIYIGQPIRYEIFILCAVAFIVSVFLPSILKVIPSILVKINNKLKGFVF